MRTLAAAPLLFALCGPASAADRLAADRDARAEQEIKDLEFELAGLLMRGEFEAYSRFLAEDYTRITHEGRVQTREEVLRQFRAGFKANDGGKMEPSDLDVKVYGDTAVLTGLLRVTPRDPAAGARVNRFRKIFVRRDGRWFMVSLQGVPYMP